VVWRIVRVLYRSVLFGLLLIAIAVAAMRIRNWSGREDHFETSRAGGRTVRVYSSEGSLRVIVARPWPETKTFRWISGVGDDWARNMTNFAITVSSRDETWDGWGLTVVRGRGNAIDLVGSRTTSGAPSPALWFTVVAVPHWLVTSVAAFPALLWCAAVVPKRRRLSRRRRLGLCLACGYDLRGSPERCPECGTIPAR
jgi:hypothetical protein